MNNEHFGMNKKGHRIYHDGTIQIWEMNDTGKFSFYLCFLEKDRVGKYLFSLTDIGLLRLNNVLNVRCSEYSTHMCKRKDIKVKVIK